MRRTIVVGCLLASASAAAECPPTAVSSGDPALVQSLTARLVASGIATDPVDGCPAVRVRVEQRGDHVHLEMSDTFARTGQRQVQDVATAAAIVESWTRHEIEAGVLPELAPSTESAETPLLVTPPRSPTGVSLAFESSVGGDSSLWLGAALSGCVAIGPACVGGVLRGARDTRSTGETAGSEHQASELHAIATADIPRRIGTFTISPGLGVGYGWLNITATHLDMHMLPVEESLSSHELRGDLHVSFVRSFGRFALVGELRGDTAFTRTDIPAGPHSFLRAGIGIRFGAH